MLWALSSICAACLIIAQLLSAGDEEHSEKILNNRMKIENFILKLTGDRLNRPPVAPLIS